MICPACGHLNLPGADWCDWCQFALMAFDRPMPQDRVDRSLMTDPVTVLGLHPPVVISDGANLGEAVRAMIGRGVGAVLMTGEEGRLVGILTERDFLTKVAGQADYMELSVGQFMTRAPETVTPKDTLAFALSKMAGGGYRHLPVVEDERPVGTVSVKDILRHIYDLCADG